MNREPRAGFRSSACAREQLYLLQGHGVPVELAARPSPEEMEDQQQTRDQLQQAAGYLYQEAPDPQQVSFILHYKSHCIAFAYCSMQNWSLK